MFDTLTVDQLNRLHEDLHHAHAKIHDRLTGPEHVPFGPAWDMAHSTACALTAAMVAVGKLLRTADTMAAT
jgi:hypothetical protein